MTMDACGRGRRIPTGIFRGVTLAALLALPGGLTSQELPEALAGMQARSIGPAGMSGRVAAVDVNPRNRGIIFVGASTGGVWRSVDGGIRWSPVFDDAPVLGIGAVAVSPSNPDVVWVGTGEGNPRNSAGVGDGIFRSLDGGESWTRMGLEGSERIHRVLVHPADADVVYAGVMGPAWSDGEVRGVFRTLDGGESWERVLFVDEGTGVGDLVMDPENPQRLLAALWDFRRDPWGFRSGGPGSGLYLTNDGGGSWTRLTPADGLPEGDLGRMGLAFSPSDPSVVYALVEAERNVLLRSEDGGRSWKTVNDEPGVNPRPFYYADLRVDPQNENRIYRLAGSIDVSEDGGKSFRTVVPSAIIHGDVHELWIDPTDGREMIMGNDGGIAFTHDRGRSWRFVENLPLAQFYQINVDMAVPFNVYGGLQDNGSWFGPSQVWEDRGIMNAHWRRTGGGDGFASIVDFGNPRFGYSMSQQGSLMRFDKETGERRNIQPIHPDGVPLRFNWNAAFNVDPFDSTTIYLGSQYVHRSRNGGGAWEIISPDLTTNDPEKQKQDLSGGLTLDATGAENHTTILSIAPSPLQEGLIWASTDDGNVQVTEDGGASWRNVRENISGVPSGTWAPHVEPSKHMPGRAYVVFEDHRRGNWDPHILRTDALGEEWKRLNTRGIRGFVHVLEEDPVEADLLFAGTEFGLYLSLDGGESWMPWRHGLPAVPVRALMVHPRDHDLVVGTHGRGVFILDDIRPLRELARNQEISGGGLHLFSPPPAHQVHVAERIGYRSTGHAMFFGENRPFGALLTLWAGEGEAERVVEVEVLSGEGEVVTVLEIQAEPGLNRFVWDLTSDSGEEEGSFSGRRRLPVLPGSYTLRVGGEDASSEVTLQVLPDPRVEIPPHRREAKIRALEEANEWMALSGEARDRLQEALRGVRTVLEEMEDGELREAGVALEDVLGVALRRLFTGPECQGICGGTTTADPIRQALYRLSSSADEPSATDRLAMERARGATRTIVEEVNALFRTRVADFRSLLLEAGYTPFPVKDPLPAGPAG